MVLHHGLHPLRTKVLKIPALAPGYRTKNIEVAAQGCDPECLPATGARNLKGAQSA